MKGSTYSILYVEGDKGVTLDIERGVAPAPTFAVYLSSVKSWDPPHAHLVLDDDDKRRIAQNMSAAFAINGVTFDFA